MGKVLPIGAAAKTVPSLAGGEEPSLHQSPGLNGSVHCTVLYTVHCTVYSVQCTVQGVHSTKSPGLGSACTRASCILFSTVQCTVQWCQGQTLPSRAAPCTTVQCTVYSVPDSVQKCTGQCTGQCSAAPTILPPGLLALRQPAAKLPPLLNLAVLH